MGIIECDEEKIKGFEEMRIKCGKYFWTQKKEIKKNLINFHIYFHSTQTLPHQFLHNQIWSRNF